MQRSHPLARIAIAATFAAAAPLALAQTNPAKPQHPQSGAVTHTPPFQSPPQNQTPNPATSTAPPAQPSQVMGQHDITGTVESVSSSGIVEVKTPAGLLKVQFQGAQATLKKGETITLHLGYTVDSTSASGGSP